MAYLICSVFFSVLLKMNIQWTFVCDPDEGYLFSNTKSNHGFMPSTLVSWYLFLFFLYLDGICLPVFLLQPLSFLENIQYVSVRNVTCITSACNFSSMVFTMVSYCSSLFRNLLITPLRGVWSCMSCIVFIKAACSIN